MSVRKVLLKFLLINILWKCRIKFWLYGPYGVADVLKFAPYPFIQPILRKYGAQIGENCVIDTGIILHRPDKVKPFKNLYVGKNCYIGHNVILDLSDKILIESNVKVSAGCHLWTHYSYFDTINSELEYKYMEKLAPVKVGNQTVLYSQVVVSPGVTLYNDIRVAAASVIVSDITEPGLYAGSPARRVHG